MKPYFDDGRIRIYHARWEDVWAYLQAASGLRYEDVALLWADPPYGVKEETNRGSKGRGINAVARDFAPVAGDDQPFNPAPLIKFHRAVLWGANHYASRLPDSAAWWFWHKRPDMEEGVDFADGEAAWTNLGGQFRYIPIPWMGVVRPSENGAKMQHPTQKPVALATVGLPACQTQARGFGFQPLHGQWARGTRRPGHGPTLHRL